MECPRRGRCPSRKPSVVSPTPLSPPGMPILRKEALIINHCLHCLLFSENIIKNNGCGDGRIEGFGASQSGNGDAFGNVGEEGFRNSAGLVPDRHYAAFWEIGKVYIFALRKSSVNGESGGGKQFGERAVMKIDMEKRTHRGGHCFRIVNIRGFLRGDNLFNAIPMRSTDNSAQISRVANVV